MESPWNMQPNTGGLKTKHILGALIALGLFFAVGSETIRLYSWLDDRIDAKTKAIELRMEKKMTDALLNVNENLKYIRDRLDRFTERK